MTTSDETVVRHTPVTFPKHILLIEDNEMDAELILNAIEEVKPGNTVTVANTGAQALDYTCAVRASMENVRCIPCPI